MFLRADARCDAGKAQSRGPGKRDCKESPMPMTGLEVFDDTVHKTNSWLKEISQTLGLDRRAAYQALRAVLHALRDRLSVDEAAHFGDQLPMLVRGIYFEAWHPAGKPEKIRSREQFLEWIEARLANPTISPEDSARAVFLVLTHHLDPGE